MNILQSLKKRLKSQSGIALLIVVGFTSVFAMIATDIRQSKDFHHQVVLNTERRIKSYYLAKSAINFAKIVLLYNKKLQSQLEKLGASDQMPDPLYKMIPLNTELLKSVANFTGGGSTSTDDESEGDESTGDDGGSSGTSGSLGLLSQKEMADFLAFEGNFDVEFEEEQSKYSLNAVTKMTTTSSSYDLHKKVLASILLKPEFKNFFEFQDRDAPSLVHALADFVDSNDSINEYDKVERGRESGEYADSDFKVKNASFLTLSETRLVAGMSDDIYSRLAPYLTVYHTSSKINACLAETELVDALILHYTNESDCTQPIKDTDKDTIEELRTEVLGGCPDKDAMANALNVKLGIKSESESESESKSSTAETKSTSSKVSGCKVQFVDLLTEDNNILKVKARGYISDNDGTELASTTITMVLNTSSSSVSSWKVLYYQVQ